MKNKCISLVIILMVWLSSVSAQQKWQRELTGTVGGTLLVGLSGQVYSCSNTFNGSYLSLVVACHDSSGNKLWEYITSRDSLFDYNLGQMLLDRDSNLIVATARGKGSRSKLALFSYSSQGALVWQKVISHPDGKSFTAYPSDARFNSSGNTEILISGFTAAIIQVDLGGDIISSSTYNTDGGQMKFIGSSPFFYDAYSYWDQTKDSLLYRLNKCDIAGNVLWSRDSYLYPHKGKIETLSHVDFLNIDHHGNAYLTGSLYRGYEENFDIVTLKYDSAGNFMWKDTLSGTKNEFDVLREAKLNLSGNLVLAGDLTDKESGNLFTLEYHPDGTVSWLKKFPYTSFFPDINTFAIGPLNDVILLSGYPHPNNLNLLNLDSTGNVLQGGARPHFKLDAAYDIASDRYGGLYYICRGVDSTKSLQSSNYLVKMRKLEYPVGIGPVERLLVLKVYPNPSSSLLTIELPEEGDYQLKLVDMSGHEVYSIAFKGKQVTIPRGGLAAGMYIYRLQFREGVSCGKVIFAD